MPDDYDDLEGLRPDLSRLARLMLRGSGVRLEPEDLVQIVLAKLHEKIESGGEPIANLRHFAYRALKNRFLDEVSRASTRRETPTAPDQVALAQTLQPTDPAAALAVREALFELTEAERRFVCRVIVEGDSVEGAQAALGWPPRSPHYRLKKILAHLFQRLTDS